MPLISKKAKERLFKAGYRLIGSHSAVKICHWTKKALSKQQFCYKRWHGIASHRCVQMTPALQCNFKCVFCWRFHDLVPFKTRRKWDEPQQIIEGCIKAQRELLSGFGGNPNTPKEMYREALEPKHFAISLDGEPTLYPHISELIEEIKERGMTAFLVTNGSMPERLSSLREEPTYLYISVCAPDENIHKKVNIPLIPDSWERLNRSLELMKSFSCATVIRHTLVKGINMVNPEKYAKLILKAEPRFIECKAFMHVGEAQKRLPREAMPSMGDVKEFAQELSRHIGYGIKAQDEASRVVLLSKR